MGSDRIRPYQIGQEWIEEYESGGEVNKLYYYQNKKILY